MSLTYFSLYGFFIPPDMESDHKKSGFYIFLSEDIEYLISVGRMWPIIEGKSYTIFLRRHDENILYFGYDNGIRMDENEEHAEHIFECIGSKAKCKILLTDHPTSYDSIPIIDHGDLSWSDSTLWNGKL